MDKKYDVAIIGAGLTGLRAGIELAKSGKSYVILESSDQVGGRVKSEKFEGCILDHGFQVTLPAYPTIKPWLGNLKISQLERGATTISTDGARFFFDPAHHFGSFLRTFDRSVASIGDLAKLAIFLQASDRSETTQDAIQRIGFSSRFAHDFLEPFLRGIFLDNALKSPVVMTKFYLRTFLKGGAAVIDGGIHQLPQLLSKGLSVELGCHVDQISNNSVLLNDGREISAEVIIDTRPNSNPQVKWLSTTCHYFLSSQPLNLGKRISLVSPAMNLETSHFVNLSEVCSSYSPAGTSLISASTIPGKSGNEGVIQRELESMVSANLTHLKSIQLDQAIPQTREISDSFPGVSTLPAKGNVIYASDATTYGSQHAALQAGIIAARQSVQR